MNWYYVAGGQQAGPVDEAQLDQLVQSGQVQPETLVWHEGLPNWLPYREARPEAVPAGAAASTATPSPAIGPAESSGGVVCSECGRTFPLMDVIRHQDRWVCASCKPLFLQRLSEGAPLGTAGRIAISQAELLARDYTVEIGGSMTKAWELFKGNAWAMIGVSLLVYFVVMVVSICLYLFMLVVHVPFLNFLAVFVTGPLIAGLWIFYVKKVRGEPADAGVAFSGFGPRYWQLVLTQVVPGLVNAGVFAFLGFVAALTIPAFAAARGRTGAVAFSPGMVGVFVILGVIAFILVVYLSTCWMFALPLAADKGLKFWPALELSRKVVNKHWVMTFFLLFACGLLAMVGAFFCGIGILVTAPVAFAMLSYHYDKVFGNLAVSAS